MTLDGYLRLMGDLLGLEPSDVSTGIMLETFRGYVNLALGELVRYAQWPWLIVRATLTTTVGDDALALPDDFIALRPRHLPYYADGRGARLEYADAGLLDNLRGSGPTSGPPLRYNTLYDPAAKAWGLDLWPTPDAAYDLVIDYRRRVPNLENLADEPAIPAEYHELLGIGACTTAEEKFERMAEGTQRGAWLKGLAEAWAQYGSPTPDQPQLEMRPFTGGSAFDRFNREGPIIVRVT